ncbi:uncharacterized protein SCHCODRAFT_02523717 [Schizophyllum commune H4-8]|nr:uncharacterized protein SCHCODRAFT_02523717 [Schizophyllum commune H4-8]KAI5899339.1 hypothetical protein SCHCODRAFT_02523717 [Schizophyllum commune H4-8]
MLTLEIFDSAQVPHRAQRHPGVPPPMLSEALDSASMCRRWQPREEAAPAHRRLHLGFLPSNHLDVSSSSTRTSTRSAGSQQTSLSAARFISMAFACSTGVLIVAIVLLAEQAAATGRTVTYGLPCPFVANNAIHAIVLLPLLG